MSVRSLVVTGLRLQDLDKNVHGAYQRLRALIEAVCGISSEIDVFSLLPRDASGSPSSDEIGADELLQHWGVACRVTYGHYVRPPGPRSWILEQLRWTISYRNSLFFSGFDNPFNRQTFARLVGLQPDLIVTHKLPAQEFVRPLLARRIPQLFDLDDIEHLAFRRHSARIENRRDRWIAHAMVPGIKRAVYRAVRGATHTLVCSDHDVEALQSALHVPAGKVIAVPNSTVIHEIQPLQAAPVLLFVGTFSWGPNVHAMDYFLKSCWPAIRQAIPAARMIVVGANPEEIPEFSNTPAGVEFTGFVPDIAAAYRSARAVICPILSGGGTRVKLVEAAAYGKAMVSTQVGAEGLGFRDHVHALLCDGTDAFVRGCVQLLRDDDLCASLGRAAHGHARDHFERTGIVASIQTIAQSCLRTESANSCVSAPA